MEKNSSREIIAYKLYAHADLIKGYIRPVAEWDGKDFIPLTTENFCLSGKVFVTSAYDELDSKYGERELFKITVFESQYRNPDIPTDRSCSYVTQGFKSTDIKPREFVEVLLAELPDPNYPIIDYKFKPSTTYIYLVDKQAISYGPFKWETLDDQEKILLKKIDSPLPGRALYAGNIFKGDFNQLSDNVLICKDIPEGGRIYFKDLTALHNNPKLSSIDYSSDEDIVGLFSKIAKELNYNSKKADFLFLEAQIKKIPKFNQKAITDKLPRFKEVANSNFDFKENLVDGFDKFLKTNLGDQIVDNFISRNKEQYLKSIKETYSDEIEKTLREKRQELDDLLGKINNNKQELVALGKEIEDRNKLKFDTELLDNAKKNADLGKDFSKKLEDFNNLKLEYDALHEKYLNLKTYDQILTDLTQAKTNYRDEVARQITLEKETDRLKKLYNESEDSLRAKLFELKPYVEAINGNNIGTSKNIELDIHIPTHHIDISKSDTASTIINYFEQAFDIKNRSISPIEIINLVVTIQQSFLSFIAGLPGGGKTSLVRLLADVKGLERKRFLEVPVARGWTGQKDLIGYFNPISNKFQASSTGVYNFLYSLNKELDKDSKKACSLVLLDEANLSPIEHYWSSFMGISDMKGNKPIKLGEDDLYIPEHLRFVATVNYDNTTEFLSHRVLDRAPVILLENSNISPSIIEKIQTINTDLKMPITYDVMEYYFGTVDYIPELTDKEQRIFDQIKSILEDKKFEFGKTIQISNRKSIAIRHYCNKARPLMRAYSDDNDVLALDYAVLQLILPQIRGNGKNFSNRLNELNQLLISHDLQKSSDCLEAIISNGDADLNTYDFFCW